MRRPLILDVNPDPDALHWEQDFLTRIETETITCCGPDPQDGCPLLQEKPCAKIEVADGILFQLDLDRLEHRKILAEYVRQLEVPIRVVVTADQERRWAHLLDHVEVFTPPIGPATMDAFAAEVESEIE